MRLSNGPRSSSIGVHPEPKSLSPSLNLFQLTSVHIAPANKPCAAVRLHVPDGCNNHPSDEKHVASLVLGYLTVGDHAIENNFWVIDAIYYPPNRHIRSPSMTVILYTADNAPQSLREPH